MHKVNEVNITLCLSISSKQQIIIYHSGIIFHNETGLVSIKNIAKLAFFSKQVLAVHKFKEKIHKSLKGPLLCTGTMGRIPIT